MTLDEAVNNLSEDEVDLLMSDPQMLGEFKTKFAAHQESTGVMGMVGDVAKKLLPSKETLMAPMKASEHLGKMVEAGGAGIGDIDANLLPKAGNLLLPGAHFKTEPFLPAVQQAGTDVDNVMAGKAPETAAGKAGKFVGSFFTPNQIALQATGEAAAGPIIKGLGKGVNAIGELLAPASDAALSGVEKAAGNTLSTIGGIGTPELETVMTHGRDAVQGAKAFPELAEDVAGSMDKLTSHIGELEKAANATLDAKKTLNVSTLTDAIQGEIKSINMADVTTPGMDSAKEVLQTMLDKVKNRGTLTQPEVAKWVKSLQGKINWNNPLGTELNEALTHVQSAVNDALKAANPQYATATDNFANAVNLKNDLVGAMGVEKEAGLAGKFEPKNVSVTKLKGLLNPDNTVQTSKMVNDFHKVPGVPNYIDLARQASAKQAINGGIRSRFAGFLAGLVPGATSGVKTLSTGAANALPAVGNAVYQGLQE